MYEERYDDVVQACNEQLAMDAADASVEGDHYKALLLRSSMMVLYSNVDTAVNDLTTIISGNCRNVKVH